MQVGGGSKLSKHVLGMKFMRKTKEQLDQDTTEKSHRKHFGVVAKVQSVDKSVASASSSSVIKSSSKSSGKSKEVKKVISTIDDLSSSLKLPAIVEETSSYSQCLGYSFGRFSFGGFNPIVEYNVSKGIWKPGYAAPAEDEASDEISKEQDVDDAEMANSLGAGLTGAIAKRFLAKKQRNEEGVPDSRQDPILEETSSHRSKGRKQNSERNKDTWITANGKEARRGQKDSPPAKKRKKFMKPSDDD